MVMPGVTKHIFNHEICDILSMFNCEIKTIEPLLPKEYSSGDIIALLKEFYPHEWHSVEIKYVYYQTKDRYIKRKFCQRNISAYILITILKKVEF